MTASNASPFTFLFTDLESSTRLWEQFPQAMAVALERHYAVVEAAIAAHEGRVFKAVGDAVHGVFADPTAAIDAAIAAQRAMAAEDWAAVAAGFEPLSMRVGIHSGPAIERAGDFFGPTVNRTARLMVIGNGGQILISRFTHELVSERLPAGATLRDWGEQRLRDLQHSEHIYQVLSPSLPDIRTPLRTAHLEPADRVLVQPAGERPRPPAKLTDDELLDRLREVLRTGDGELHLTAEQALALAQRRPRDLEEYRLGRVAAWSQPTYRLDKRFVELSLLLDEGDTLPGSRWRPTEHRFTDLYHLIGDVWEPVLVLLGHPGTGKSTLLRRLDVEMAVHGLRGEDETLSFFVQLNHYWPPSPGEPPLTPEVWLGRRWHSRYPDLPPFLDLLMEGRVLLLLDGLNEMPHRDDAGYRQLIGLWKRFLTDTLVARAGNRAVFACRSLDYSAPLSGPGLRVVPVRIEPLSDAQVQRFITLHSPAQAEEIWSHLRDSPQLEVVRTPYLLKLLLQQIEADGYLPRGRAALFTGFVWQALQREIERENPLFEPEVLLTAHDHRQLLQAERRDAPFALPERGLLVPHLNELAFAMQQRTGGQESSQVRLPLATAIALLDHPRAEDILRAGEQVGVLQEDAPRLEIQFFHQMLQEYFAARRVAKHLDDALIRVEWRADAVEPSLEATVAELAPADPLPPLPTTRWEETVLMAAAMSREVDRFVTQVAGVNLSLAARCASQADVHLSERVTDDLRRMLVERSRDAAADLRARIDAGLLLGRLGDPRFERWDGPFGTYLMPPLVEIPGGTYRLGAAAAGDADPELGRAVVLPPFRIGQFPVTNAEWTLFLAAGGYEDERWWDGAAARLWRLGEGTDEAARRRERAIRHWLLVDERRLEQAHEQGRMPRRAYERWLVLLRQSEAEFEEQLVARFPGGRKTTPQYWSDAPFINPAQPVVGICLYEAQAYGMWLAAQTGLPFRPPTEAEWEAAGRGFQRRTYAWGDDYRPFHCNTVEARIRGTTPVGVFPAGDTPEGAADLCGNIHEWTTAVPRPADGARVEDDAAGDDGLVPLHGGSWGEDHLAARLTERVLDHPTIRGNNLGIRLVVSR